MFRFILTYFLTVLLLTGFSQSQKRNYRLHEIGMFGGGSYYIGDINQRKHFEASHPAFGLYYKYSSNFRFAFRFGYNYGNISGNDAVSGEADQMERNLNFTSKIHELHSIAEFNFVEYRIGHDRYKFTMYIFGGLGAFRFNPYNENGDNLRYRRTEGQTGVYPKIQMSIPFGVGIKFNIGERCGVGLEWGPRNTFTDYLDDVKGDYPEGTIAIDPVEGTSTNLSGSMRGNPSTKDWYFFYGVTLSFKLPGYKPCHKGF